MREELPIRWHTFAEYIETQNAGSNTCPALTLSEVTERMNKLGITDDKEVHMVLQFYHDTGRLIYHQGCNLIILDPQWLNDVAKKIIVVIDDGKKMKLKAHWLHLKTKGLLSQELIKHVWRGIVNNPDEVLQVMDKFDLICAIPGTRSFFVPCRSSCNLTTREQPTWTDKVDFIIDVDFLPVGFLHRFYVRMARWAMEKKGPTPNFHYREMIFYLDSRHRVVMKNDQNSNRPNEIQVTVYAVSPAEAGSDDTYANVVVNRKFIDFLSTTLEDLRRTWARGINFQIGILCRNCQEYNEDVLIPLHKYLESEEDLICCEDCHHPIAIDKVCRAFSLEQGQSASRQELAANEEESRTEGVSDLELLHLASELGDHSALSLFGVSLGMKMTDIDMHLATNRVDGNVSSRGTKNLLLEWRRATVTKKQRPNMRGALIKAGFLEVADKFLPEQK